MNNINYGSLNFIRKSVRYLTDTLIELGITELQKYIKLQVIMKCTQNTYMCIKLTTAKAELNLQNCIFKKNQINHDTTMSCDSGIATIYRFLHITRIQELRLSIGAKIRDIFRVRILVRIIHKKYKNKNKPYRLHLDWCIGSDCVFS